MNLETSIASYDSLPLVDEGARARKRRNILIALVILFFVANGAYWTYSQIATKPDTGDTVKKSAATVTVIVPGTQLVEASVNATGSLAARHEMPVGVAGEGGTVTQVWVEAGSWVKAGQVLASIERSVQFQQSNQLEAQIASAQADVRLAQGDLDRALALVERGFVSKAEIDRKSAQRDGALARVRVARAQLAENQARIGRLDVRAPASGLVLARNVEQGQVVGAASNALFRLARDGAMEMRADLGEADLAKMRVGLRATVTPVGSTQSFEGPIFQIAPVIDPQTRQGIVRIALGYHPALRPGGFASAAIRSGSAEAPLLPESAVLSDAGGNFVYVLGKGNAVQRRDVQVGSVTDKGVSILGGLSGAEHVVASAGGFLNPGETINPRLGKLSR